MFREVEWQYHRYIMDAGTPQLSLFLQATVSLVQGRVKRFQLSM
jgi:hypothetical protein